MIAKRKRSETLSKVLSGMDEDTLRRTRDRMLIASRISDALEARNLTQKRFAAMMGKSESEISEWLSGERNFTINTLSDIYACLGMELFGQPNYVRNAETILGQAWPSP